MTKNLIFGIDCDGVLRDSLRDMVRIMIITARKPTALAVGRNCG